jgi:hypothetical protein
MATAEHVREAACDNHGAQPGLKNRVTWQLCNGAAGLGMPQITGNAHLRLECLNARVRSFEAFSCGHSMCLLRFDIASK